jgi:hypothetical protein
MAHDPKQIEQLARTYTEACAAFPDIEVFMDDLVLREDGIIEYRWTFTGTSAETGKSVRVPGFEEWTMDPTEGPARSRAARGWDAMAYSKRVSRASTLAQATATYLAE